MNAVKVELRCPATGRLFGRVSVDGDPGAAEFEVACRECRQTLVRQGRNVGLVLHLFDGSGVVTDTVAVDQTRGGKTPRGGVS